MNYYVAGVEFSSENSLTHHGIKGQKWGIRRYQNPDGSLTSAGRKRYKTFDELKSIEDDSYDKLHKEFVEESREVGKLQYEEGLADRALERYQEKRKSSLRGLIPKKRDKQLLKLLEDSHKKSEEYERKKHEVISKYQDKYASVMLRDLGYEDTQEAREWLKDRNRLLRQVFFLTYN